MDLAALLPGEYGATSSTKLCFIRKEDVLAWVFLFQRNARPVKIQVRNGRVETVFAVVFVFFPEPDGDSAEK